MIKGYRLLIALIVLAGFLPFYWLFEGDDLFTMLDSLAVSIGIGVLIAYAPAIWYWLRVRRVTVGIVLTLGILITWFALVSRLNWLWFWRLVDRPDDLFDHPFVAFTIYCAAIGASLHLLANSAVKTEDDDGEGIRVPVYGWAILIGAITIGLSLGLFLVYYV